MADPQETTTVPDPSELTTEQMLREVNNLRRELLTQIENAEAKAELRMADLGNRIKHGQDVHDERFLSVDQQFKERDIRAGLTATSGKEAIDAALASAKELVTAQSEAQSLAADKAEKAMTEQLKALREMVMTEVKSLTGQINEVKERLARENGSTIGAKDTTDAERANRAEDRARQLFAFSLVSIIITVIVFANSYYGA